MDQPSVIGSIAKGGAPKFLEFLFFMNQEDARGTSDNKVYMYRNKILPATDNSENGYIPRISASSILNGIIYRMP